MRLEINNRRKTGKSQIRGNEATQSLNTNGSKNSQEKLENALR